MLFPVMLPPAADSVLSHLLDLNFVKLVSDWHGRVVVRERD